MGCQDQRAPCPGPSQCWLNFHQWIHSELQEGRCAALVCSRSWDVLSLTLLSHKHLRLLHLIFAQDFRSSQVFDLPKSPKTPRVSLIGHCHDVTLLDDMYIVKEGDIMTSYPLDKLPFSIKKGDIVTSYPFPHAYGAIHGAPVCTPSSNGSRNVGVSWINDLIYERVLLVSSPDHLRSRVW